MREILFRAKIKTDNAQYKKGDWVQGDYVRIIDGKRFIPHIYSKGEIIENTISQYTGLTDKNGKKIFEGDIVDVEYDINYIGVAAQRIGKFEVIFNCGCFMKKKPSGGLFHFIPSDKCKVIGNIHDNPELLKGE